MVNRLDKALLNKIKREMDVRLAYKKRIFLL
jgi:hypothetical protein